MNPKRIVLIGATGSIGESTQQVVRRHPEHLRFTGLANRQQRGALEAIAEDFGVTETRCFADSGIDGLIELAEQPEADIVIIAANGTIGIRPAIAALEAGKDVALASKEVLVTAGRFVTEAARKNGGRIIPIDSEHNALFQCLQGEKEKHIGRLILTASGGPFRNSSLQRMAEVTPEEALKHPNWSMGPKVTIDSATMANKGLEVIEAHWLFGVKAEQIAVTIHPQSIVHSLVEFIDGSIKAQLSPPTMTFAIQHALLYPDRAGPTDHILSWEQSLTLDFSPPDYERFPCLRLAEEALRKGSGAQAAYNAANEVAVNAFVEKQLPFLAIPRVIEHTLEEFGGEEPDTLDAVFDLDEQVREAARAYLNKQ